MLPQLEHHLTSGRGEKRSPEASVEFLDKGNKMARRGDLGHLFIGRLNKNTRTRDLEEIFEAYGRLSRCEIKYGPDMAYGFVDFEDRRDAQDALRYENGRTICGNKVIVEWAKGTPRRGDDDRPARGGRNDFSRDTGRPSSGRLGLDECAKCHRTGHWAKDCPDERRGARRKSRSRSRSNDRRQRRSRSRSAS